MIQERVPADITKWIIAGTVISVTFDGTPIQALQDIASGTTRAFWVSIDFGGSPETTCEVSLTRTNVLGALGTDADFFVTVPTAISGDVITVTEPPPKKKSKSPQGEGGCSTGAETSVWLLALLLAVLTTIGLRGVCKQNEF